MNFMTIKYVQEMRQQNVATASKNRINIAGYVLDMSRGDNVTWTRK